jgi:hypothetical protein
MMDSLFNDFANAALAAGTSKSSIDNYNNRLRNAFGDSLAETVLSEGKKLDKAYDELKKKYPNVSSRRNVITALLAFLRHIPPEALNSTSKDVQEARNRWGKFHEHMRAFQEARYKKHVPDVNQMQKYVGYDEIELKYQELKKSKTPHATLQQSQDILLLSIIISTPPKRADLGAMHIVYKGEDDPPESKNHIVINTTKITPQAYMVMMQYKTSGSYGRIETDLPTKTVRDLLDSLRKWPRDFLFIAPRTGASFATNNAYGKWVQSVFTRLFGRATGVTMLRHIFITEKVDFDKMDDDQLEDLARQMLHSPSLQRKYNWNKEKICTLLTRMCPQCKLPATNKKNKTVS